MTPCVISPITTLGPVCGGHGQCLPFLNNSSAAAEYACQCDQGWYGGSDFQVTSSLTDCHIPATAITVLWAVYLGVHLLMGLKYVPQVRHLVHKHYAMKETARQKGRQYSLRSNKPLLALLPYFLVGYPMQLVYAAYKLANVPQAFLGQNAVLTVTYLVWRTTFFFAISMFQSNFLASLLVNEKKMQGVIAYNFRMVKLHFAFMTLLSACIIAPAVGTEDVFDPVLGMTSAAVFLLCTSVGMLLIGVHAWFVKKHVVVILDKSYAVTHDVKTLKLNERFTKFQRHNVRTAFAQFVIYGVFGAWPYLWNKHEWMVPVVWVPVLVTFKQALDSLIENLDGGSTVQATAESASSPPYKTSTLMSASSAPPQQSDLAVSTNA